MAGLARLAGNRFLVIGRAGMDLYADPPGTRTEDAVSFLAALGGSSANIAVSLTRQGAEAALVTCVADDAVGRYCLKELDRYGVDRRHVRSVSGEARNSLSVVETRIENHQSVIYRNGAADFEMGVDDIEGIDYPSYSALITTGTVLAAEPSRSAAFRAFELARAVGVPLVFDVDYRPYSWTSDQEATAVYVKAAAVCDVIVGNDVEFGLMAGSYERGLEKARELARKGTAIVVYKMGEKGAVTLSGGQEIRTGVFKSEALKPTGAGDSFLGAFMAALSAGHSVENAVIRGSAAAAIVVSRVGCAPAMPTTSEINDFISIQKRPGAA